MTKQWWKKRARANRSAVRDRRNAHPSFELLEDRCLLAVMPLKVEITKFETNPGNAPDTGGGGSFFAEIKIGNARQETVRIDSDSGDFDIPADKRENWSLTSQVNTATGPLQIIIHVQDFDTGLAGAHDEMDVSPVANRRGELVLLFNPLTGGLTNEDNSAFPGFGGLQGIHSEFGFFSIGKDDPDTGQVFFKISFGDGSSDNDGDALLDVWETWGIDNSALFAPADLTRTPDLRLPQINPDHKNVYVEVDAMLGLVPQNQALTNVVNAFAAVPNSLVNNPDGQPGITLRVDLDETNIPRATWNAVDPNNWPTGFDTIKGNISPGTAGGFGTVAERSNSNAVNILSAKRQVYHYSIFGDQYAQSNAAGVVALTTSSGKGEGGINSAGNQVGGNDFMVTLGNWPVDGGTLDQQAATFMHELGHNLGFGHGGGDNVNWKPNYHSVMNYIWQLPFTPAAGAALTPQETAFQSSWTLDYSRNSFNQLDETNLNEAAGIGGHAGHVVQVGPVVDATGNPIPIGYVNESGSVDWDGTADTSPPRDINFQGDTNNDGTINGADATPGQPGLPLLPFVDWNSVVYNFRNSTDFSDGVHHNVTPNELTREAFIAFTDVSPPTSTLTIGSPKFPINAAQPFVSSATSFSLSATDGGAGVHSVSYRYFLQGSTPPNFTRVTGSSTQFVISGADGTYQVETLATDKVGNTETAHVQLVMLDNTAPVITIVQPAATEYVHSAFLTLNYTVSDGAGSGVNSFMPTLNGATILAGHGLQSGQVIHLLTELPLGTHTFAIDASDNLQNNSSASVTFEVIVTPESIKEDVRYFRSVGAINNRGLADSLLSKLNAAANAIQRNNCPTAINIYRAFISELNAQTGRGVTSTAAAIMIADAEYLIANCDKFVPMSVMSTASSSMVLASAASTDGATAKSQTGQSSPSRKPLPQSSHYRVGMPNRELALTALYARPAQLLKQMYPHQVSHPFDASQKDAEEVRAEAFDFVLSAFNRPGYLS